MTKTDVCDNRTTTYVYDDLGRLKSETVKTGGITNSKTDYTFDQYSNRSSMVVSSGGVSVTTNYTYDLNNRLTNETPSSGSAIAYTYDKNGNQLTKGGTTNTYNLFNQLVTSTKSGVTTTYTYNPDGTRHSKTVGVNPTTYYLWQGGNMVAEYTLAGNPTAVYTYGINLITSTAGSTTRYYLYNAHGDVTGLADTSGTVVKYYRYDAFGNEINADPNDTNPFRYSGQYFDKETGDYYLQARYYDPSDGRFTQQDDWGYANASDPLSLNLYTYCMNDPVDFYDPSGHVYDSAGGVDSGFGDDCKGDADPSYWANDNIYWNNGGSTQIPSLTFLYDEYNNYITQNSDHSDKWWMWSVYEAFGGVMGTYGGAPASGLEFYDIAIMNGNINEVAIIAGHIYEIIALTAAAVYNPQFEEEDEVLEKELSVVAINDESALGLKGVEFENYLTNKLGGYGSFSVSGREFDGGNSLFWWEAKSGGYWDLVQNDKTAMARFTSQICQEKAIANGCGRGFVLFSNTAIPQNLQVWLTKKGIPFIIQQ